MKQERQKEKKENIQQANQERNKKRIPILKQANKRETYRQTDKGIKKERLKLQEKQIGTRWLKVCYSQ